jgi:outer membrane protein OmpA-like peptidoglycan-associated protein
MRILLCHFALAIILLPGYSAFCQTDSSATEGPHSPFWIATGHSYVGAEVGVTGSDYIGAKNYLWGIVSTTTPSGIQDLATYLPYDNLGTGIGFVGGLKAGFALFSSFDVELKFRYMTNHTSNQESVPSIYLDPNFPKSTSDATNNYSLTLSTLNAGILGHYRISDPFYLAGGFSASNLIANSFSANQHISVAGGYLRLTTHTTSNINTQQVGSESLNNWFTGFRADAQIGAGYVFRVGQGSWLMDVEGLIGIPFTRWQTAEADSAINGTAAFWKLQQPAVIDPHLWYATLTVGIRLPFHDLPPVPKPPPPITPVQPAPTPSVTAHLVRDSLGIFLTGHVTDANTGKPLPSEMTAVDLSNNHLVMTTRTDSNGNYSIPVPGSGKFSVTANAPGYLFGTAYFEVDSEGRVLKNPEELRLSKIEGGKTRLLVFFDFDKADLQSASTPELDRAVQMMNSVPTLKIEIAGYTDSIGTLSHNMDLSQRRANAVRDYLVQHGITASRIVAQGYGPASPIMPNTTDDGRAQNRRVEFVVKQR